MRAREKTASTVPADSASVEELRAQLREAEETLRAIRTGDADAIVVQGENQEWVYTLQSADQPYRDLVEQMREGALILTIDGDILYSNRHFADMVEFSIEEIVSGPLDRFIQGADLAAVTGEESGARRCLLIARSGRRIPIQLSHSTTIHNGVERRNLIITDLREILNAESGRERAERENRLKDEFLAMLGHELRNPLAAISTGATLLQSNPVPERRAWIEQMLARQVTQLQRLVDDLVDVSRINRGKIGLRKEAVLLQKVLEAAATSVEELIAQRRHQLTMPPPQEIYLNADPARLEQMVVNLLTNAAKFTSSGGEIRLSAEQVDNEVVIRCRDTGRGLSAEMLESIFEPFVQIDAAHGRSDSGLGVGLTLVRKLAELHGGTVTAASRGLGEGSEFTLRLPSPAASGKVTPAIEEQNARDTTQFRVRRVLLVDDNDDLAESLTMDLSDSGHNVVVAHDGETAISIASNERPEVVLLDIGLPGMDGFAVAERLRAMPEMQRAMIIAISGYKLPSEIDVARTGIDLFLTKPIKRERLAELLQAEKA